MHAAPKSNPFPTGDRAALFGALFTRFYEQWDAGGGEGACKPSLRGMLRIANSKADEEFLANYHAIISDPAGHVGRCKVPEDCKKKPLTLDDMDAIVGECWNLMDRIGTWDWQEEDREELVVP